MLMIDRRQFVVGAGTLVAAPFVMRRAALGQTPLIRRDVMAMSADDPFFSDYADAVAAMHELQTSSPSDGRNWRAQALIHLNHCPHSGAPPYPDVAMDFVHWHRWYIRYYEEICGVLIGKSDFALPYWNWQAEIGQVPNPFYDVDRLNVVFWNDPSDAQSDNWGPEEVVTTGVRALAEGSGVQQGPRGGAFTDQNINSILAQTDFTNFTHLLETSPHNNAHVIVGGSQGHMGDGMSPLDPIFWLHHCNVDRLAAQWQAAGNTMPPLDYDFSGQFVNGEGQPAPASSATALDISALGYAYETPTGIITGPASSAVAMSLFAAPATGSQPLGAAAGGFRAAANQTTAVSVDTRGLGQALFSPRSFRLLGASGEPRIGTEPGRILARLTGVTVPAEARGLVVNVFVNLPEAGPETPVTDPHFAGSFGFFMAGVMDHSGHGGTGGGMAGGSTYPVDITDAVLSLARLGRLTDDALTLQVVPIPTSGQTADSGFSFEGVEIFRT
ncbi:tyrosinase family protein [Salinarimonas ramus]|uniref:Tyrosinase n=1 Tax=Salinarimonas ramus TaxID=690164 RepID=A0A917QDB2_9HYPH|nr:tyrosinase family protein [Salinarimonas ramus]GGK44745.1 tyrosinase [Salinarimonas ramus]